MFLRGRRITRIQDSNFSNERRWKFLDGSIVMDNRTIIRQLNVKWKVLKLKMLCVLV